MTRNLKILECLGSDIILSEVELNGELDLNYINSIMEIQACSGKFAVMDNSGTRVAVISDTVEECIKDHTVDYRIDFSVESLEEYIKVKYYNQEFDKYDTYKSFDEVLDEYRIIFSTKILPFLNFFETFYKHIVKTKDYSERKKILKSYKWFHIDYLIRMRSYNSIIKMIKDCKTQLKKHFPDEFKYITSQVGNDFDHLF